MTVDEIEGITRARLATWGEYLSDQHATPALVVGIGHDGASGNLYLTITKDMSRAEATCLLREVLARLANDNVISETEVLPN